MKIPIYNIIYIIIILLLLTFSIVSFYVSYLFDEKYKCIKDEDNPNFSMKKLYIGLSGFFFIIFIIVTSLYLSENKLTITILTIAYLILLFYMIYVWILYSRDCTIDNDDYDFLEYFKYESGICSNDMSLDNGVVYGSVIFGIFSIGLLFLYIQSNPTKRKSIKRKSTKGKSDNLITKYKKYTIPILVIISISILILIITLIVVTVGNYRSLECITVPPSNRKIEEYENVDVELQFYHNPKCAGTTIHKISDNYWKDRNFGMNEVNGEKCFCYWTQFVQNILGLHRPFYTFKKQNYNPEDKVFTIVRNPYEYVIGLYKQFSTMAGFPLTVDSLNVFVGLVPFIFAFCKDDLVMKSSFDTQYNKIHKNENEMCDYVLRYENVQNEFNELMEKYNYPYRMTDKTKYNVKQSSLSVDDLSEYNKFIIRQIYRNDFVYFGYER